MLKGPFLEPRSGKAKQLVIFLHGLGANGDDLFSLVPYFSDLFPDAYFSCPDAPFPCDMAPFGLQWFSLKDRSGEAIIKGIRNVSPILNEFIDSKLKELNLLDKDLVLVGFSQGAMLAMNVALRRKNKIAGVIAYSGAIIGTELLATEIVSRPPICLLHGEQDQVVPFFAFSEALNALKKNNVDVQGYSRPDLGHGIDPAGIKIGLDFLKKVFNL